MLQHRSCGSGIWRSVKSMSSGWWQKTNTARQIQRRRSIRSRRDIRSIHRARPAHLAAWKPPRTASPLPGPSLVTTVARRSLDTSSRSVSWTRTNGSRLPRLWCTIPLTSKRLISTITCSRKVSIVLLKCFNNSLHWPLRVTGLIENHDYEFRVAAENAAGRGPWSSNSDVIRASAAPCKYILFKSILFYK